MKRGLKVIGILSGTICLASLLILGCIYLEDFTTYAKTIKNKLISNEE